jgi:PII-like signaling protein
LSGWFAAKVTEAPDAAGQPARLLRIHISESDRFQGKPLYEAIVERCRELKIAGATSSAGLEGLRRERRDAPAHLARRDQPILISIVDTAENLSRLVPVVEEMMDTGLMAVSDVRVVRVQKKAAAMTERVLKQAAPETVQDALGRSDFCRRYEISALEDFLESCRAFAQEKTLNIAVLGRFKAGKSSFLNHLLGRPLLPVGVIPVTSVVTEIQWGPASAPRFRLPMADGTRNRWPDRRVHSESENPENSKQVAACASNCRRWSATGESGSSTRRAWRASSSTTRTLPWSGCRTWGWLWWRSASTRLSPGTTSS